MALLEITDDNFQSEVLDSDGLVLVDFWAPWCVPCQMLGPIIEQISEELSEKVKIGKMNVDESQQTASKYNVMSIPTVFLFKDGEIVEQFVGVRTKDDYADAINKHSA
ncbi:MAG: thioredoxin [bacterium]